MLRLCKQIKGGKRIKLIGGPGNGMIFVASGKMGALKYEVDEQVYYYKRDGLTDGKHELFSFLGKETLEKPKIFDNPLIDSNRVDNSSIMNSMNNFKEIDEHRLYRANNSIITKSDQGVV